MTPNDLKMRIRTDVERLCGPGDRDLGTERNRTATDYALERMRDAGLATEQIVFEVPEWRAGDAKVSAEGFELLVHPGPFSAAIEGEGLLVVIRSAEELQSLDAPGAVLLLCDEIANDPLTPRDYPFYHVPQHAEILDALEAARPLAVLAATTSSAMAGAMSPFPLIEEVRFSAPHAYLSAEQGVRLAEHAGETVRVAIDSAVLPSTSVQPIGRLAGSESGRVLISAHIDSKPGTPGAIDNASGVAVLLAVADLLGTSTPRLSLEFVPFNGEDHTLAPGELAYLGEYEDLSDIRLVINLDAPGLPGDPSAYSLYGTDEATTALAARLAEDEPSVAEGPQWPASDHMIFAMRGIPAMAITSTDFATASRAYSHTPADTPDILDFDLLAGTARFVAELVANL